MIHSWLLIVEDHELSKNSRFFTVDVPSTKKGQKDLSWLINWTKQNNYFLQKTSCDTDNFKYRIATSLKLKVYELSSARYTISKLIKTIKFLNHAPEIPTNNEGRELFLSKINPKTYFIKQTNVIRQAEAEERKKPKSKVVTRKGRFCQIKKDPLLMENYI